MENKSILDNDLTEGLTLSGTAKDKLIATAKWAKFLSICLFLSSFSLIYLFVQMTMASRSSYSRNSLDMGELVGVLLFIAFIVLTFFAAYNLLSFANRAILGLRRNNNKIFAISIESLKSYFKFYGYYMVIVAILMLIFFYSIYVATSGPRF